MSHHLLNVFQLFPSEQPTEPEAVQARAVGMHSIAASPAVTLGQLIEAYKTDPDSSFHGLRYHVRVRHDQMLRRIALFYGTEPLQDIRGRTVKAWYREWSGNEAKLAAGHAFVGQIRTLFRFGQSILELEECTRLAGIMSGLRFKAPPPNKDTLTAAQIATHRAGAHEHGYPSIALSDAFQFEASLRQKDLVGEWVPEGEPGESNVHRPAVGKRPAAKWLRGALWEEIDGDFIFRHTTSKKLKPAAYDLKLAQMVMDEFARMAGVAVAVVRRDMFPATGPIVVCEYTGRPWVPGEFRRRWRIIARAKGLPDNLYSMHHRSAGITESFESGADPDKIRQSATHSQLSQTLAYHRSNQLESTSEVMQARAAKRQGGAA